MQGETPHLLSVDASCCEVRFGFLEGGETLFPSFFIVQEAGFAQKHGHTRFFERVFEEACDLLALWRLLLGQAKLKDRLSPLGFL